MWWASTGERPFGESSALGSIDRSYRALDGFTSYMAGLLLKPLGLVKGEVARVELPESPVNVPVAGPEDMQLILSVERERGIQFHFHVESTPPVLRDRFWHLYALYAEGLRDHAEKSGWPVDREEGRQSMPWWRLAKAVNTAPERAQDPVQAIGILRVG